MANASPSFVRIHQDVKRGEKAKTSVLATDPRSPTAPRIAPQNVLLYHFYRGREEFFMPGLMDEPVWPDEYCKVALFRATFKQVAQLSSRENWATDPSVLDTWPWIFFQNCADSGGYRETCDGDVLVEDNGHAWRWTGSRFTHLGLHLNKAADPDPADAIAAAAERDDDAAGARAPSINDEGESALVRAERERERTAQALVDHQRFLAQQDAAAKAAGAAAAAAAAPSK